MTSKETTTPVIKVDGVKFGDGAVETATLGSEKANIAAATEVSPSGAPVQIVPDVDLSHPAVDANPRANTTVAQNKIDFNDPTVTGAEAVARALKEQGVETKTESDK